MSAAPKAHSVWTEYVTFAALQQQMKARQL